MKQVTRFAAVALAAVLWFGAPPASARGKGGRGGPQGDRREVVENRLKALDGHLNLNQGQQIRIRQILVSMVAQANAIRDDKTLNIEQKMRQTQATREAAYDRIAAELTPQQRAKFAQHRSQLAGIGGPGPNAGGPHGGGHKGGRPNGGGHKGNGGKGDKDGEDKGGGGPNGAGKGNKDGGNNNPNNGGDKGGPGKGNRGGGENGGKGRRGPRIAPR